LGRRGNPNSTTQQLGEGEWLLGDLHGWANFSGLNGTTVMTRLFKKRGFSLLELMAAMAILMIIVVAMGMILRETNRSWLSGVDRAYNSSSGRACLDIITRDMQYAIADDVISFCVRPDTVRTSGPSISYGFTNSEACFVSLINDPTNEYSRAVKEIFYFVRPAVSSSGITTYEIARGYYDWEIADKTQREDHCYMNPYWYEETLDDGVGRPLDVETVAENVSALAFWCPESATPFDARDILPITSYYTHETIPWSSEPEDNYPANGMLPLWVDVYVEMLSEDDARRAGSLTGMEAVDYVEKKARRYTTRVFLHNRSGYTK